MRHESNAQSITYIAKHRCRGKRDMGTLAVVDLARLYVGADLDAHVAARDKVDRSGHDFVGDADCCVLAKLDQNLDRGLHHSKLTPLASCNHNFVVL